MVVALLCSAPLLFLGLLSIAGPWSYPALLPEGLSFDRWVRLVSGESDLLESAALSFLLASTVGLFSTTLGLFTARAISEHRQRRELMLAAYLPLSISPVILGVCLLYLFIRLRLVATLPGVILAHVIFGYAFSVVFWIPFWNTEKRAYADLVRTLGGRSRDFYWRVLLPLSRGPFIVCFFQTFLISWFQYGLTLLVGSGKIETLPLKVYDYVTEANVGYAAVAGCLLVLPPILLAWVNQRIVRRLA
jgi:putative spermidine/putrescine transport system permease protein